MIRSQSLPIILASQSPRRIQLLGEITDEFQVIPSEVEEVFSGDRTPGDNAVAIAREKAQWVADRNPNHCVLGADTIVVLNDEIIGKPEDEEQAYKILKRLSGKIHSVITGVALVGDDVLEEACVSTVSIKPLTNQEIYSYIQSGEPMDKAGAYAIQGKGAFMVKAYEGSFSNIVGLPLETVRKLLNLAGFKNLSPSKKTGMKELKKLYLTIKNIFRKS